MTLEGDYCPRCGAPVDISSYECPDCGLERNADHHWVEIYEEDQDDAAID